MPQLGDSVWYGVEQSEVLLKVSPQSLTDYRNAPQWCNFMTSDLLRGDVNADGKVDIADVNILINIMLGKDDADNYDGRAYLTDDMVVDIADVNAVINLMLGKAQASDFPGDSDVNDDGMVDVSDVNIIINLMLGK